MAASSNYTLTLTGANLSITPKTLTVVADAQSKVYGASDPVLSYVSQGLVGTDTLTGSLIRATGNDVGDYAITQNTLAASSNYTLTFTGANLSITPKTLTVVADAQSKVYGASDPVLSYVSQGLVGTDTLTGSLIRATGNDVGDYAITQNTLAASSNYTLAFTGANLSITPKTLTVVADAQSKVYGESDPVLSYVSQGLVGTDTLTGALIRATGDAVGDYEILQGNLAATANYNLQFTSAWLQIVAGPVQVVKVPSVGAKVLYSQGALQCSGMQGRVNVYNLRGALVASLQVQNDGVYALPLPAGVYSIRARGYQGLVAVK